MEKSRKRAHIGQIKNFLRTSEGSFSQWVLFFDFTALITAVTIARTNSTAAAMGKTTAKLLVVPYISRTPLTAHPAEAKAIAKT